MSASQSASVFHHHEQIAWSAPYIDALGLGLLMTVSAPVTDADTGETVGVVGIDVSLETVEDLLKEEEWGEVRWHLLRCY